MPTNAATRVELLANASDLLEKLNDIRGISIDVNSFLSISTVQLAALCRILYELVYNPPPRNRR